MSYCRPGDDSDLYLFPAGTGPEHHGVMCQNCKLGLGDVFLSRPEMLKHLGLHLAVGHCVPIRALLRLMSELGAEARRVFRSECPCPCHEHPAMMHFLPCCDPDEAREQP